MDLLKIDGKTINLDRLSVIVQIEEEIGKGTAKAHTVRKLQLVLGDTSITLDENESHLFIDFIESNYRVRDLMPKGARGSRGGIDSGRDTDTGVIPTKSGDGGG